MDFHILAPSSMYLHCPGLHSSGRSSTRDYPRRLSASHCSLLPPSVCSDPATRRRDQRKQPAGTPMLEKKRERMSQGLQPDSRPEPPLPANPHPPANGQLLGQNVKCKSTSSSPCKSGAAAAQPWRAPRLFSPIPVPSQTSRTPSSRSRTCQSAYPAARVPHNVRRLFPGCAAARLVPNCKKSLQLCPSGKKALTPPTAIAQASCSHCHATLPHCTCMQPYHTAHACNPTTLHMHARQPSAQRHAFTGWPCASRRVSYSVAHATAQLASLVSTYALK